MTATQNHTLPRFAASHMIEEAYSNRHARFLHMHENELELFYVYSGAGQYIVDNEVYEITRGDIVVCNARVLHGEDLTLARRVKSYCIALADVQLEGLPPGWLTAAEECPVLSCGQLAAQVGELMRTIHLLSADQIHLGDTCSALALGILRLTQALLESRRRHEPHRRQSAPSVLAQRARQYLDAHHHEALTLGTVAQALRVSEYYLAHVFREEFGLPPMQYVMKRRIGEAQGLLMDTAQPIAEIAEQLGYSSPCHFNAMFRKYVGMPPGAYREAFRRMRKDENTN